MFFQVGKVFQGQEKNQIQSASFAIPAPRRHTAFPVVKPINEIPAGYMKQMIFSEARLQKIRSTPHSRQKFLYQCAISGMPGVIMYHLNVKRRKCRNVDFIIFSQFRPVAGMFLGRIAAGSMPEEYCPSASWRRTLRASRRSSVNS